MVNSLNMNFMNGIEYEIKKKHKLPAKYLLSKKY